MHTLDKDCWYPLWKLMKSQCDILISRASKWCKIMMEWGGSDTTDTTTQLFLSLDLKAPWEGDLNHTPPTPTPFKRNWGTALCRDATAGLGWSPAAPAPSQPNTCWPQFPLEQRWDLPWAGDLCVCLCVCLWVPRFYREKDPRHNNKQRGNQFNGQLGKQVLPWLLGV